MIAARRNLFALAALGLCAAATAAGAQQRPPRSPAPLSLQQALAPECGPVDRKQEKRDADKVRAAEAAFARGGFKGLRRHVPALEDVVRRAPKDFEAHESCGMMASLLDGLTRAARTKSGRREVVIEVPAGGSPYPRASLLAGSYAIETGAFEHAAALLLRGLEMTPTDPGLTTEAAGALTRLDGGRRRFNLSPAL